MENLPSGRASFKLETFEPFETFETAERQTVVAGEEPLRRLAHRRAGPREPVDARRRPPPNDRLRDVPHEVVARAERCHYPHQNGHRDVGKVRPVDMADCTGRVCFCRKNVVGVILQGRRRGPRSAVYTMDGGGDDGAQPTQRQVAPVHLPPTQGIAPQRGIVRGVGGRGWTHHEHNASLGGAGHRRVHRAVNPCLVQPDLPCGWGYDRNPGRAHDVEQGAD
jgi:hypothetical protein